jgi:DNA-binding transcriptional MerR regulator
VVPMSYSVSQVAKLAGVTVRTLHHYDEVGLLVPGERTAAGYRRYTDADLERLQQVLFYRELGFALEEIATLLDDPKADAREHFRAQHRLLTGRIKRLQEMVTAIEFTLEAQKVGIDLTPRERFEVFGDFDPDQYAEEAQERWGGTDAYAESARRTSSYTKEDWLRFRAESADWGRRLAAVMDSGAPADSPEAMELAEEHRRQISQWFYECGYEIHTGLADMYVSDPRFTAAYETIKPGMAAYLHDAIHANAGARA